MSKLDETSGGFKDKNLSRNSNYNDKHEYNISHSRAISDGDEFGKNDGSNGTIGGTTDIKELNTQIAKNPYSKKEYNASNNS